MNNSPCKILIVDDDEDVRVMIKDILELEGFTTYTASNGKEGLQKFEEFLPELVITDIRMPVMDGVEFVKNVQKIKKDAKVIFISGWESSESKVKRNLVLYSHYKYLKKPFDVDDILLIVQNYLNE
ncbi:response regulator [candidate division KSB1 bacterium]